CQLRGPSTAGSVAASNVRARYDLRRRNQLTSRVFPSKGAFPTVPSQPFAHDVHPPANTRSHADSPDACTHRCVGLLDALELRSRHIGATYGGDGTHSFH